jgi:hypothetical protein
VPSGCALAAGDAMGGPLFGDLCFVWGVASLWSVASLWDVASLWGVWVDSWTLSYIVDPLPATRYCGSSIFNIRFKNY